MSSSSSENIGADRGKGWGNRVIRQVEWCVCMGQWEVG